MTKPPPARYKIVERDGRLITIDTWAKPGAAPPAALLPGNPRWQAGAPRGLAVIGARMLAAIAQTRDAHGRRLLTTGPRWDARGPRTIALGPRGEQRLGTILALGLLVTLAMAVAILIDTDLFFVAVVLAVLLASSIGTVGRNAITRLLDSFDDDVPG